MRRMTYVFAALCIFAILTTPSARAEEARYRIENEDGGFRVTALSADGERNLGVGGMSLIDAVALIDADRRGESGYAPCELVLGGDDALDLGGFALTLRNGGYTLSGEATGAYAYAGNDPRGAITVLGGEVVFDGLTLSVSGGSENIPSAGVYVGENGSLLIAGGAIECGSVSGFALYIDGAVVLSGGSIRALEAGGVCARVAGSLRMTGGALSCAGAAGKAIYVPGGVVDVSGGEIRASGADGCCAYLTGGARLLASGGAMYAEAGDCAFLDAGALEMTNGSLSCADAGHAAARLSGGAGEARFALSGGEVAHLSGGCAIDNENGGEVALSGGVARAEGLDAVAVNNPFGSLTVTDGARVFAPRGAGVVNGGAFAMTGGAVESGEGVALRNSGYAEISGGRLASNADAVRVDAGAVALSGGAAEGADGYGAYVASGATVSLSGGARLSGGRADLCLGKDAVAEAAGYAPEKPVSVRSDAEPADGLVCVREGAETAFVSASEGWTLAAADKSLVYSRACAVRVSLRVDGAACADAGVTLSGEAGEYAAAEDGDGYLCRVRPGVYEITALGRALGAVEAWDDASVSIRLYTVRFAGEGCDVTCLADGAAIASGDLVREGASLTFTAAPGTAGAHRFTVSGADASRWTGEGAYAFTSPCQTLDIRVSCGEITYINAVSLTGLDAPRAGETPDADAVASAGCEIVSIEWMKDGAPFAGAFEAGGAYGVKITLAAADGCAFPGSPIVTLEGADAAGCALTGDTCAAFFAFASPVEGAPELYALGCDRAIVRALPDREYSFDGVNWFADGVLEGMTAGARYEIVSRETGGEIWSEPLVVTALAETPAAPRLSFLGATRATAENADGCSLDGGRNWVLSGELTGLTPGETYELICRAPDGTLSGPAAFTTKRIVEKPDLSSLNRVYDGDAFSLPEWADILVAGADGALPGAYTATVALADPETCCWPDERAEPIGVSYVIEPIRLVIRCDDARAVYDGETHGGGAYTVEGELAPGDALSCEVTGGGADAGAYALTCVNVSVTRGGEDRAAGYEIEILPGTLTVEPRHMTDADVAVSALTNQAWTGAAVEPKIEATYRGAPLVEGIDFAVVYEDNVEARVARARVSGLGNFAGEVERAFSIVRELSGALPEDLICDTQGAFKPYAASCTDDAIVVAPVMADGENAQRILRLSAENVRAMTSLGARYVDFAMGGATVRIPLDDADEREIHIRFAPIDRTEVTASERKALDGVNVVSELYRVRIIRGGRNVTGEIGATIRFAVGEAILWNLYDPERPDAEDTEILSDSPAALPGSGLYAAIAAREN